MWQLGAKVASVDIIILSWDRIDDTIDAVQSAVEQEGVDIRVQVVDQGSNPDDLQRLVAFCDQHECVTIICNDKNAGVAGGRNQATNMGSADYVIALDNDAVFADKGVCARAANIMDADPGLGGLAFGVHVFESGTEAPVPDKSSWVFGELDADTYFQDTFPAKSFVGAGHLLRRSSFNEVGQYDERLFFMHEEWDLCDRLLNAGYRLRHCGDLAVRHKVSPEHRVKWKSGRYKFHVRNAFYLHVKQNQPLKWAMSELVVLTLGGLRGGMAFDALKGFWGGLNYLPAALKERADHPFVKRTDVARASLAEVDAWLEGRLPPNTKESAAKGLGGFVSRVEASIANVRELAS